VARETVFAFSMKLATRLRSRASGSSTSSEFAGEVGEHLVLLGEDPEDLVRRAQGRGSRGGSSR
jgi:hypothetical protein